MQPAHTLPNDTAFILPGCRPVRGGTVVSVLQKYQRADTWGAVVPPWIVPALALACSVSMMGAMWTVVGLLGLLALGVYGWRGAQHMMRDVPAEYTVTAVTLPFTKEDDPEVIGWLNDHYMNHQSFNRVVVESIYSLSRTGDHDVRQRLLRQGDALITRVSDAREAVDGAVASTVADAEAAGTWQVGMAVTVAQSVTQGTELPAGINSLMNDGAHDGNTSEQRGDENDKLQ